MQRCCESAICKGFCLLQFLPGIITQPSLVTTHDERFLLFVLSTHLLANITPCSHAR